MAKTVAYRGQDRTLEMIRTRAESLPPSDESANWNAACFELIAEMNAEGLTNTAAEIEKHVIRQAGCAVVTTTPFLDAATAAWSAIVLDKINH